MTKGEIKVLFEDKALLAIDKPAGVVVNRAESVSVQTIQDWVDISFDYELAHNEESRNGIVHRLDKETSGVLLLAKTGEAMAALQKQFHDRETQKTYWALVHGKFIAREASMRLPMDRNRFDRQSFAVSLGGRMTETRYRVIQEFNGLKDPALSSTSYQGFSLVEVHPKTGRTHQIRVFMTHLKHPLVGDEVYAGEKRARADAVWCERQFLHAQSITFFHPLTRLAMTVTSALPSDLQAVLDRLE